MAPPVIDVIRAAQATHEVTGNAYERDPDLTASGEAQAARLGRAYREGVGMRRVSHVVSSPLRRAARTALIAFEEVLLGGKAVVLLPELQGTGVLPNDTGHSPAALRAAFRPQVDTSLLDPDWHYKGQGSKYVPDAGLVEARAREARVFLRGLARAAPEDARIVVVGHGAFLHFLTGDFAGLSGDDNAADAAAATAYGNAAMRSFRFVDLSGTADADADATMVETEESCRRSGLPRYVGLGGAERERLRSYAVARVQRQKRDFDKMTRCNRPQVQTHVF
ncbi:putative phosphoglycerate mutase family protein [Rosellinia necatrix]|uniref:Putative phosphoglycerate mutase family protein n=1 Tax=Rosellinia necatrix TaxID=77044 RepID=A0A1W2TCG1_ROSNE|nr:putative phosphoglycerate mutase family protein [Rosellinia necatrix]